MVLGILFLAGLAVALLFAVRGYSQRQSWEPLDRLLAFIVPPSWYLLGSFLVLLLLLSPYAFWNNPRLAASVAMVHGYRLYYPADTGPILNTIYPPFSYILYLPAALSSNQDICVMIAATIALVLVFTPVVLIHLDALTDRKSPWQRVAGAVTTMVVIYAILNNSAARMAAVWVHADAPALGLAGSAAALLYRARGLRSPWFWLAALLTVLAVATKQTMLPLALALPLWLGLARGLRTALWFVAGLAIAGLAVLGLLVALCDFRTMYFNAFQVPGGHPWKGTFPTNLAWVLLDILKWTSPFLLILLARAYVQRRQMRPLADWLNANTWALFALVAILLTPTVMLGRVKVGGAVNTLAPTLYFYTLAVGLVLRDILAQPQASRWKTALKVLVAFNLLHIFVTNSVYCYGMYSTYHEAPPSDQRFAYETIRKYPGKFYFPNFPLAHLMAEGKLRHHDYAVFDRELAGFPVTWEHFWAHMPEDCQVVCFSPKWFFEVHHDKTMNWDDDANRDKYRPKFLGEFTVPVKIDGFPDGWWCYIREQ